MDKTELLAKANAGDAVAVEELANSYYMGLNGFEEDNDQAFTWFLKSERLNSKGVITLNGLGGCYYFGYGTEKDEAKGLAYYRKAAELGYKNAQYNLADKLDKSGNPECVFWYTKAAEQDYGKALYRLFEMYRDGEMVKQDTDKAVWCLEHAAQVKYVDAMLTLGYQYGNGDGGLVPRDNEKSLAWTLAAANEGSSTAMSNLAISYRIGDIVDANIDTAIEWAKKAAENGDGDQLFYIAVEYKTGEDREQDTEKAYELFKFDAEHGHDGSMIQLALHELGSTKNFSDVGPDAARASLEWAKKAAALGNETGFTFILRMGDTAYGEERAKQVYFEAAKEAADNGYYHCMLEVYRCYSQGYGTAQDASAAVSYLQRAANGEWPEALFQMAQLYESGSMGVEVDQVKAFELYKMAAERDYKDAYNGLGDCYREGKGTDVDMQNAIYWYSKCADEGTGGYAASSAFWLAHEYFEGKEVDRDLKKCLEYLEKANVPSYPNPAVQNLLDKFYSDEQLEDMIDPEKARQFYYEKANAGDPHAMYEMGRFSEKDMAIPTDESVAWMDKAATAGDVQAQFSLGIRYMIEDKDADAAKYFEMGTAQNHPGCLLYMANYLYSGSTNIPQNEAKAFEYYCRAADAGNPTSTYRKGVCYFVGRGTAQNFFEAFSAFKKAQELGCNEMWYELGMCYFEGKGTGQDMEQAIHCFHQGADGETKCPFCTWKLGLIYAGTYGQSRFNIALAEKYLSPLSDGNNDQFKTDAQFVLGLAYDRVGNTRQALTRWEQAANNGSSNAQYNIGVMYFNGQQVPRDLNKALYYFQLAAAQGHEDAIQSVQDVRAIQARQSQAQL